MLYGIITVSEEHCMHSHCLNHVYRFLLKISGKSLQILKVNFFDKCGENLEKLENLAIFFHLASTNFKINTKQFSAKSR